jgi:hypothetical protein
MQKWELESLTKDFIKNSWQIKKKYVIIIIENKEREVTNYESTCLQTEWRNYC